MLVQLNVFLVAPGKALDDVILSNNNINMENMKRFHNVIN